MVFAQSRGCHTMQKARSRRLCNIPSIKNDVYADVCRLQPLKQNSIPKPKKLTGRSCAGRASEIAATTLSYVLLSTSPIVVVRNAATGQIHTRSLRRQLERGVVESRHRVIKTRRVPSSINNVSCSRA